MQELPEIEIKEELTKDEVLALKEMGIEVFFNEEEASEEEKILQEFGYVQK